MKIHKTSRMRVSLAFLAGAVTGSGVTTFDYLRGMIAANGLEYFQQWGFKNGATVFTVAALIWLVSLLCFGGPVWLLARWKKMTNWYHALMFGFLVPLIVLFVTNTGFLTGRSGGNYSYYAGGGQQWEEGVLTLFGWKEAALMSFQYALLGAVVAWVTWMIAYFRVSSKIEGARDVSL